MWELRCLTRSATEALKSAGGGVQISLRTHVWIRCEAHGNVLETRPYREPGSHCRLLDFSLSGQTPEVLYILGASVTIFLTNVWCLKWLLRIWPYTSPAISISHGTSEEGRFRRVKRHRWLRHRRRMIWLWGYVARAGCIRGPDLRPYRWGAHIS
jgi:hypothetical protein